MPLESIQSKIHTIRDMEVILDSELAELYGIELKRLNEQVKRNILRFPRNFRFQLKSEEYQYVLSKNLRIDNSSNLRSQFATSSNKHGGRRYLPYVFTEQGVSMLSAVLNSKTAIDVSIRIINSFVKMRRFLLENGEIFKRINRLERKQISFEIGTGNRIESILSAIESKHIIPKQGIFYDGQIFDAYIFIVDIIKNAKQSIVLIDNYIDETVLTLLTKRDKGCSAVIYTKCLTNKIELDLKKHNAQYPGIIIKEFKNSHDRFLIIDNEEIYHIGASLKDLGKKIFAFSRLDKTNLKLLDIL